MILKKFLGKTLDAAKKSARQMYGDDFVILESSSSEEKEEAGITVMVKQQKNQKQPDNGNESKTPFKRQLTDQQSGVRFERSSATENGRSISSNLEALRKFAATNQAEPKTTGSAESDPDDPKLNKGDDSGEPKTKFTPGGSNGVGGRNLYSRASIRNGNGTGSFRPEASESEEEKQSRTDDELPKTGFTPKQDKPVDETAEAAPTETSGEKTETPAPEERGDSLLSKFDRSRPKIRERTAPAPPAIRREQREITALHKRFDKIEALLDSAFISTNLDYASHPAFQQLVHTGIGTSVIAGWFSEIIKQGIDPYEQNEIFMNKLSGIIRDALSGSAPGTPEKYLLFTGPSGAGKTNLVMKLCMHPEFLADKKLAVVSLLPQGDKSGYYYTILDPFCRDHTIPYFQVKSGAEVTRMQQEWEEYDHILIDTPSISTEQNHSFREYWKIRQLLASLTPLEVHYVVNASMNRYYFQNSTAANHPLQPDYVAITHLDEVSQWGPVIPFLKQMGCSARYISQGDDLPGSLNEFDPTWFARKVLQDS